MLQCRLRVRIKILGSHVFRPSPILPALFKSIDETVASVIAASARRIVRAAAAAAGAKC